MLLAHAGHGAPPALGWVLAALLVAVPLHAYVRAVRTRRERGRGWPRWRTASFASGLVLVALAVSPALSPALSGMGHDPRTHMAQHLLLGMVAPLPLVLAAPVTLLLGAVPPVRRRTVAAVLRSRVVHVVSHPAVAAVLDVGGLHLLHLTSLSELTTTDPVAHQLVNLHFLIAGCLFTWSIAGPDPAPRRPGTAVRAAVLVLAGAAHNHLATLLYARAVLAPGADAAADRAAAQLMYYGGDVTELALAVALFAGWYRRAQPAEPASSTRGARSG